MIARTLIAALTVLLLAEIFVGQSPTKASAILVAPPTAKNVAYSDEGHWFAEGCHRLEYTMDELYPGNSAIAAVTNTLRNNGWRPIHHSEEGYPVPSDLRKKLGKWDKWENVAGGETSERIDIWRNQAGDIVNYTYRYMTSAHNALKVVARFCSYAVTQKYRCVPSKQAAHSSGDYSLNLHITKVEPFGKDYKVFVSLENDGREPVLLGVNGEYEDGSPELWVLGVEQEELGEWSSADAICAEHPALDYITLKSGESIDSWVMAVDFPEPNYHFAKCTRKVGHLNGRIRAYMRYYRNPCELLNPLESTVHSSVSEPSVLPVLAK